MVIELSESGLQDPDTPKEEILQLPKVKYVLGDARNMAQKLRSQIHKQSFQTVHRKSVAVR